MLLVFSLVAILVGFVIYRRLTRGEAKDTRGIGAFAGEL
jgi:spermidine/putrescine transport system permease protein